MLFQKEKTIYKMGKEHNIDFLEIAETDIKSAILLYTSESYSQSYFLFQQASEKANKSIGLLSDFVSSDELFNIGHDQFKVYKKALNQIKEKEKFAREKVPELMSQFPSTNYQESLNTIGNLKNHDLVNLSESEVKNVLEELEDIINIEIPTLPDGFLDKIRTELEPLCAILGFKSEQAIELIKSEVGEDGIKLLFSWMIHFMKAQMISFYCALITTQHSTSTRYGKDDKSPLEIYSKDLPLVKYQPIFMNYLEQAIKFLKSVEGFDLLNAKDFKFPDWKI